ncbi:hypothetical protein [Microbispora sp. NPDC046933]|uniref:hypothetical protein n=1 Tax=Microbispora sp. NPDC046933 TaxID=3155618 RepID=UPI0033FF4A80
MDILDGALYEVPAGPGAALTPLLRTGGEPLGAVAPLRDHPGHWLAAVGEGVAVLGSDGTAHWLARPEAGKSVRFNAPASAAPRERAVTPPSAGSNVYRQDRRPW